MSSLSSDLDRFLRTDGIRILIESGAVRTAPSEPLTEKDIDGFADMDLDSLSADDLEDLLDKAEDLLAGLEDDGPESEDSDEYGLWNNRFSETEDFIDRIRERLFEKQRITPQ